MTTQKTSTLRLPMNKSIIWTYSNRDTERETFEARKVFIGRWLVSGRESSSEGVDPPRLFVFKQKCIVIRKVNGDIKIILSRTDDPECPESPGIKELDLEEGMFLFLHNWKSIPGHELIPSNTIVLDYSSADEPHYSKMMDEVRNAGSETRLVEIASYWKDFYLTNVRNAPLCRLKQQALNLFAPLHFSMQHIRYLWQQKEFYQLQQLLEELKEEWQGTPALSRSPHSELRRLWYLLAGDRVNWKRMNLMPPGDVSLPRDRTGKEITLVSWIENNYSEEAIHTLEPRKRLLDLSGLKENRKGFSVNHSSGMMEGFATSLEAVLNRKKNEKWPDILSEPNILIFFNWYESLNTAFDQLLEGKVYEPERAGHQL